nr:MAG TPA: hypothetical protein [Caudoviricetes sp.]
MAKKVFKAELSVKGLNELKRQLLDYKNTLPDKMDEFVRRLAEKGIPVVEKNISKASYKYDRKGIQSGSNTEHRTYVKVDSLIGLSQATLILEGREVLFIEFGAGVKRNGAVGSSPHPKGPENGFLIGTYGMGHGSQQVWGYYADNGDLVLTHGTKATMPMYKADMAIMRTVVKTAKEVFGN